MFWNEQLQFTKIVQPENNVIAATFVVQRLDTFYTLREDRKMIKLWNYELIEKGANPGNSSAPTLEEKLAKSGAERKQGAEDAEDNRKKLKHQIKERRTDGDGKVKFSQYLKTLEATVQRTPFGSTSNDVKYALEVNLTTTRSIYVNTNFILRQAQAEEMKLIAVLLDSYEVAFWDADTAHQLWKFTPTGIGDCHLARIILYASVPAMQINQEMLYLYTESTLLIYDLVLREQIQYVQCKDISRIYGISTLMNIATSGIFLFSFDEKIHNYNNSSGKLFLSFSKAE
jgi:hypothetical protein